MSTSDLVDKIRRSLYDDRRVSLLTYAARLGVSEAAVDKFVYKDLNMRKICAKFVPRSVSDEQKESQAT